MAAKKESRHRVKTEGYMLISAGSISNAAHSIILKEQEAERVKTGVKPNKWDIIDKLIKRSKK